jgi:uncharacterized OB-fold protein
MTDVGRVERDPSYVQHGTVRAEPDIETQWWWDAIAEGIFAIPHCRACGEHFFPPSEFCPICGRNEVGSAEVAPSGTIYSWVVVHRALDPAFADDVPYTVVTVHLDAGARMFGRLMHGVPRDGARVVARTYETDGQVLIGFVIDESEAPEASLSAV